MKLVTEVFGKWILAGEHAVLRGVPALVFPLKGKSMSFFVEPAGELSVDFSGSKGDELRLVVWSVIERALEMVGVARATMSGRIRIVSELPLGAGLGTSAALCVGVGRWLIGEGKLKQDDLYTFAKGLENLFHGESSGVDVAVAMESQGIKFFKSGDRSLLKLAWTPQCYLSNSGQRGATIECVQKVKDLFKTEPRRAEMIDQEMRQAVALCEQGLCQAEFGDLAEGIQLAAECFLRWGLVPALVQSQMEQLKNEGAVAVKPTGSGNGGYVLSLWQSPPPPHLNLIKCY